MRTINSCLLQTAEVFSLSTIGKLRSETPIFGRKAFKEGGPHPSIRSVGEASQIWRGSSMACRREREREREMSRGEQWLAQKGGPFQRGLHSLTNQDVRERASKGWMMQLGFTVSTNNLLMLLTRQASKNSQKGLETMAAVSLFARGAQFRVHPWMRS